MSEPNNHQPGNGDMPTFDLAAARIARDEALGRVDDHADERWMLAAENAIEHVAEQREQFTTDAVWHVLQQRGVPEPREKRAMGAAMQKAARRGRIERTNETKESVREACHARDIRVWRSLITKVEANA